uniref:Uncharacterized protein n=1 Tax=Xenopus tropicalis TaxID=8364 RepID=A0A6I8SCJ9_XENTR
LISICLIPTHFSFPFLSSSLCFTCRCGRVNITGSIRKTLLDSLFIEAAMICEFTTSECPVELLSPPLRTVEFSVDRNRPRLL